VDLASVTPFGSDRVGAYTWAYAPLEAHARALLPNGDVDSRALAATLGPAFDVWGACLSVAEILLGQNVFHAAAVAAEEALRPHAGGDTPEQRDRAYTRLVSAQVMSNPAAYADHPAWCHLAPDIRAFLTAGLHPDPAQRATIAQLRGSEWGRFIFRNDESEACAGSAAGGDGGSGCRLAAANPGLPDDGERAVQVGGGKGFHLLAGVQRTVSTGLPPCALPPLPIDPCQLPCPAPLPRAT
jgi:hypothetical protein